MTDWLILAGCLVVAWLAWGLDNRARDAVEEARRKAFLAQERNDVRVEPDAVERLGPAGLVWLNGQDPSRMREGAVAGLVAAGLLRRTSPDGPGRQRWIARGRLPETADPFERELWTAALPPHVRDPAHSRLHLEGEYLSDLVIPNSWHLLEEAKARLISEGYLRDRSERVPGGPPARGRWSTIAAAATVPAVAVLLLDQAWIRAALALVIGALTVLQALPGGRFTPGPMPPTTAKGDEVLRMAFERYAELDPATRPATEPYDPGQVRMAVALYGPAVLDHVDARMKGDWGREAVVSWGPGE
ncbi:hypothetical protein ACWDR3_07495 [Streptomyces sp. NPDC001002]